MVQAAEISTGTALRLNGVRRTFEGGVTALDGIDLVVPEGQFLAILGPSGCGKSTLLRLVAGLDHEDEGTIEVGPSRDAIAYVFQDPHLMPWRTVLGNVILPLELRGADRQARREAALAAIERVGLADAVQRFPNQLSGGMRMRVSLARALVTRPRMLLLDEPFAALDELTRQKLDEQLYDLWRDTRMTVLFVTHSVSEAAFLSQRSVVMTRRPGRILVDVKSELPEKRAGLLRTDEVFSRECRVLYEALEEGSGNG